MKWWKNIKLLLSRIAIQNCHRMEYVMCVCGGELRETISIAHRDLLDTTIWKQVQSPFVWLRFVRNSLHLQFIEFNFYLLQINTFMRSLYIYTYFIEWWILYEFTTEWIDPIRSRSAGWTEAYRLFFSFMKLYF